jgi:putative SOS response-associated peptidase YedK
MCGRYTLIGPARLRGAYPEYDFEEFSEYRLPRFNVAPTQDVIGVLNDGTKRARSLVWGMGERINARSETLLRAPIAWRCILFADGFYEWRERKPYHFTLADGSVFAFAATYEPRPDGRTACAIVTVPANELVATTHDRMPAILPRELQEDWLAPGLMAAADARRFLQPYDPRAMHVRSASMRLNSARYDAPDALVDDDPVQERLF